MELRELMSVEINVLVKELKESIEGSYLKKFYDIGDGAFRFLFHGNDNVQVFCKLNVAFDRTLFSEEVGEATPFAMSIRKRVENAKVSGIRQHGLDRIIEIEFTDRGKSLIIEMFGKGNMLLVDRENRIETCYKNVNYRERKVRPGELYAFPSTKGINNLDEFETIDERLKKMESGRLIVKLSGIVNVGPLYLEDIIRRSGLDPNAEMITEKERMVLAYQFGLFGDRIKTQKPRVYSDLGKFVDYSLCEMEKYKKFETKEYGTLNDLLDELYTTERSKPEDEERNRRLEELKANIKKQEELAESLSFESKECTVVANKIFEMMNEINALIHEVNESKGMILESLESGVKVIEIDRKNKTVTIEV